MKSSIIILLLLLLAVIHNSSTAQSFKGYYKERSYNSLRQTGDYAIEIGAQTNRSIRGWRSGWNIDLALAGKFRLGYFRTSGKSYPEQSQSTDQGAEFSYMFNSRESISFGPQMRVTLTDKRFVSLIPMIQARISILPNLALRGGIGMSDRYPIFDTGISLKLN